MNDKQRAALVEELVGIWDHAATHYNDEFKTPRPVSKHAAISEAVGRIDRLLAARAATAAEPDAETVKQVARAMFDHEKGASGATVEWDELLPSTPGGRGVAGRNTYYTLAEAAIAAMPSSADDNWLDAALDSVQLQWAPGEARIKDMWKTQGPMISDGERWHVKIACRGGTGSGFVDEDTWTGTGTTRREAILDACAKAKEQTQ